METTENAINWFEIATVDFNRAKKFHESVFDINMKVSDFPTMKMATFIAVRYMAIFADTEGNKVALHSFK